MITRVLIADDDPRITEIHQHYVSKVEGFEVVGLSNTLEDTEMQIRVMEPQLILLAIYFVKKILGLLLRDATPDSSR